MFFDKKDPTEIDYTSDLLFYVLNFYREERNSNKLHTNYEIEIRQRYGHG